MSAQLSRMFKAYDVRGLAPGELDAEVAYAVGAGFADVVVVPEARPGDRPRAVLGADMRPSGGPLADAFAAGLTARGADVVRLGLTSTDEMYYAAGSLDVPGVDGHREPQPGRRTTASSSAGQVRVRSPAARVSTRSATRPSCTCAVP